MHDSGLDDSLLQRDIERRTDQFKHNQNLESLSAELFEYLNPVENLIESSFDGPVNPPLFIVGNPRSGTTMFLQFLALSGAFAYPSNFLARFFFAPYIGSKLQELLTNPVYDFKNELSLANNDIDLLSDLGKTKGTLAPNEFNFFWRRFIPVHDPQYMSPEQRLQIDTSGLRKGIAAIENVFMKPFAGKVSLLQYNIDFLYITFSNCIIVYIQRLPIYIMQSILLSRERYYNDRSLWWSVKPKEYKHLCKLDVYHQIAGQVYYTHKSITEDLAKIPTDNKLVVSYETLCQNPKDIEEQIIEKYGNLNHQLNFKSVDSNQFHIRNSARLNSVDLDALQRAYDDFETGLLSF